MATFKDCVEAAKKIPSVEINKGFDDIEFVSVTLDQPVFFKAYTRNYIMLTSQDSNEEIDKFFKIVTGK